MPDTIVSGAGVRNEAKVDSDLRLWTSAKNSSLQHIISHQKQGAFQVIGTATLASGTVVVLHGKNSHQTKDMIFTYIRHQIIDQDGGTEVPNASNYFRIALNRTYTSGGSTATPAQMFAGNGTSSQTTWYQGAPTLGGTATEIDRWYTKAEGDMNTFNKEGTVICPPNGTIEMAYVGDQSSGTVYCRASFVMDERG